MRKWLFPLGSALVLAGLSACGPSPEAAVPKGGPAQPGARKADENARVQAVAAAPTTYDLSPVPEPGDVVHAGRWKNPAATLSALAGCAGLDPRLLENNGKRLADIILRNALNAEFDTAQLANLVALDTPIDSAMVLIQNPKKKVPLPAFAMSVGLTSLERAKGALEGKIVEVAPGMWRVGSKDDTDVTCFIAASAGSAPARLICGERDRDVLAVGPYLARTMPTLSMAGADAHADFRFTPIAERYGKDLRQQLKGIPILLESQGTLGEPKFDKAVAAAAAALQDEVGALIGDFDKVSVDIGVDPAMCIQGSAQVMMRGNASWISGTMADSAQNAGPAPSLFWRLPRESTLATYAHGSDPARFKPVLQVVRDLADGAMAHFNIGKPADRKAVVDLLDMPHGKDTNTVQAVGYFDETAPAQTAKKDEAPDPQKLIDSLLNGFVGWTLIGVDEGPAATTKMLKGFIDAYNKHAALAVTREKAEQKFKDPKGREVWELNEKERADREKKLGPRSLFTMMLDEGDVEAKYLPTVKSVAAPASLGKGAMDVEIKFSFDVDEEDLEVLGGGRSQGDGKKAKKRVLSASIHVLLMGEDKATWVAIGADREALAKKLLSVKAGAPSTSSLASRPGLEPLKNKKLVSGGFFTIAPVTRIGVGVGSLLSLVPGAAPPEVNEIVRLLSNLPHKGETPIFFMTEAQGGSAPKTSMSFSVPKAALEDVGALVMGGIKLAMKFNP